MTDAIIVALITAAAAVIGQWLLSRKHDLEKDKAQAVRDQKVDDKLEGITERLDVHNSYAEKFSKIKGDINDVKLSITKMEKDIEFLKGQAAADHHPGRFWRYRSQCRPHHWIIRNRPDMERHNRSTGHGGAESGHGCVRKG